MRQTEQNSNDRDTIYLDGRWVSSSGSDVIEVENPATEQIIGRSRPAPLPTSTERSLLRALRSTAGRRPVQKNNGGAINAAAPFGGDKHSGVGRELGRYRRRGVPAVEVVAALVSR